MSPRWRARLGEVVTWDLRSLACMRVLTGAGVVWDVLDRARDLTAHYTDDGVLPTATARALVEHFGWFSLHTLSGSYSYQLALALLALLLGLLLVAGLGTRLVTPLSWLLCVSVQGRFCLADYPGDYLLAGLLLAGCFLPWGAWYSADAWLRTQRRGGAVALPPPHYRGASGCVLLALFALLLGAAGLSKLAAGGHWRDGTALFLTLSSRRYAGGWLAWTLEYPALLRPISYALPWLEIGLSLLLLSPWRTGATRTAAIASACALFVSFSIGLDLGAFTFLAGAAAVGLLPPWFWERLLPRLGYPAPGAAAAPPDGAITRDAALLPRRAARVSGALASCLLVLHVTHHIYKIGNFGFFDAPRTPPAAIDRALDLFRLKNIFRMFADPSVFEQSDGWDVAPGELADGRRIDALTGRALTLEPPPSVSGSLGGLRWTQYLTMLNWYPSWSPRHITHYYVVDYQTLREGLARYLCRRWNGGHGGAERLVSVSLAMVIAEVRYMRPRAPARIVELLERPYRCEEPAPVAKAADHAR